MNIQWYPGHMTKARRAMKEDVKLVDLLIEVLDARVPVSSRNPDIDSLGAGRARLILLNKADLAGEAENAAWERYFTSKGYAVVKADARNGAQLKKVNAAVQEACREKLERDRRRGIVGRPVRAMVVGIPNVGKSTFINSFAGKACVKTGNKPGVTKGNQWIRLNKTLELLDTPGLLWPKFEDETVGLHLAMIGSINDQILNKEELAIRLIRFLQDAYPGVLEKRYGFGAGGDGQGISDADGGLEITENSSSDSRLEIAKDSPADNSPEIAEDSAADDDTETAERRPGENDGLAEIEDSPAIRMLRQIALRRGCLIKGGGPDYGKAAELLLDDFRSGRLGRITLELPPEEMREQMRNPMSEGHDKGE